MVKETDKTVGLGNSGSPRSEAEEFGHSTTVEIPRSVFGAEVRLRQRACLEILGIGERDTVFELGDGEVFIGRSRECEIQLPLQNVSRRHARLVFRNDEYHIEDLESTNGIYLNGIRVVKAILRDNDHLEIGGVRLLFIEKTLQKP